MGKLDEISQKERDAFKAQLLAHLTNVYSFSGTYPEEEKLLKKFLIPKEELRQFIESPEFQSVLKSRGFPSLSFSPYFSELVELDDEDLDPTFVAVANVMTNPADTRSDSAKLKMFEEMGVTKETWTGWLTQPKNANYVISLVNKRFDVEAEIAAKTGLMRKLKESDLNAIKYYNEISGKYRPIDPNSYTMSIMVAMLMEILTRHLPPTKVDIIAEELEKLQLPRTEAIESRIIQ